MNFEYYNLNPEIQFLKNLKMVFITVGESDFKSS